eukprot:14938518-Alexandrium_andersonii.AAC.1
MADPRAVCRRVGPRRGGRCHRHGPGARTLCGRMRSGVRWGGRPVQVLWQVGSPDSPARSGPRGLPAQHPVRLRRVA